MLISEFAFLNHPNNPSILSLIYQNGNNDLQCVIFDCLGETNAANTDN